MYLVPFPPLSPLIACTIRFDFLSRERVRGNCQCIINTKQQPPSVFSTRGLSPSIVDLSGVSLHHGKSIPSTDLDSSTERERERERGRDFNTVVSGGPSVIATRSLIWRASAVSCLVGAPTTRYRSPFDRLSLIEHRPLHFTPLPFASRLFLLFVVLDFCFHSGRKLKSIPRFEEYESKVFIILKWIDSWNYPSRSFWNYLNIFLILIE